MNYSSFFERLIRYDMVDKGFFINSFDLYFKGPIKIQLASKKLRDFTDIHIIYSLIFLEIFFGKKPALKKCDTIVMKKELIFYYDLRQDYLFNFFDKLNILYFGFNVINFKKILSYKRKLVFSIKGFFSIKKFPSIFWGWDPELQVTVPGSTQSIKLLFSAFNIILK